MTTQTGRIVYDREKNYFKLKDVERIIKDIGDRFSEVDCYQLIDMAIKNLFKFYEEQITESLKEPLMLLWRLTTIWLAENVVDEDGTVVV